MMYLYNGHPAPELPAYSQEEFPYALIVSANADNTALILMLCVNRPYYGVNPQDSTKTGVYNTGRMLVYTCTDTEEAWTFSMETENPLTANDDDPGGGVLWTLEDILKADGSVWMAGTQPVPERVSEAWVRSFKEGLALGLTGAPLPYTGTAEQWETLCEYESLRCYEYASGTIGANISLLSTAEPLFTAPTKVRLTVDNTVIIETCTLTVYDSGKYRYAVGNRYLLYPASYEDDGRDFAIEGFYNPFAGCYVLYLRARSEGTYRVKVEAEE